METLGDQMAEMGLGVQSGSRLGLYLEMVSFKQTEVAKTVVVGELRFIQIPIHLLEIFMPMAEAQQRMGQCILTPLTPRSLRL